MDADGVNPFDELGKHYYPGSQIGDRVYQDMSALGITTPAHRSNMEGRMRQITDVVDITNKRVLDIGCSNGGLALLMAREGAHVTGVDLDPVSIRIARHVSMEKGIPATFHNYDIWSDKFFDLIRQGWDVVIWYSNYQWLWKQQGTLRARRMLRMVSDYSQHLFFETAENPGTSAAGHDYSVQGLDGLMALLEWHTVYDRYDDLRWVKGWVDRHVIHCYRAEGSTEGPSMFLAGPSGAGKTHLGHALAREHDFYHYDFEPVLSDHPLRDTYRDQGVEFFSEMRRPLVVSWGIDHTDQAKPFFDAGWTCVWLTGTRDHLMISRTIRGDQSSAGITKMWDNQFGAFRNSEDAWTVVRAFNPDGTRRECVSEVAGLLVA